MKATARKKMMIVLLGAGVCALIADRFLGPADTDTDAAQAEIAYKPAATASDTATADIAASSAAALSGRIRQTAKQIPATSPARDIFCVSASWRPEEPKAAPASQPVEVKPSAPRFEDTHHLNAVMMAGRRSSVIVDGKMITLGQTLDGYRLIAIGQDLAVFEADRHRVELKIDAGVAAIH